MTLVHEDEDLAARLKIGWQVFSEIADVPVDVSFPGPAELLDERTDQRLVGALQDLDQVRPARRPVDVLVHAVEDHLDLLVELLAIGDDQHAAVHALELADPLRQPHHREALAAALGVPDDPAFAPLDEGLCLLHAEVLVVAANLLDAGVEHHEVVEEFEQAGGSAEVLEIGKQWGVRLGGAGFLPA